MEVKDVLMSHQEVSFDAEVEARVRLLERWSSAMRHEMGNILYPSQSLLAAAGQSSGVASEIAARMVDMIETLDHNRASLGSVRSLDGRNSNGATVIGEWWASTRHLLRAVVGRHVPCSGPDNSDHALPATATGLTMLVLPVFVGLVFFSGKDGIKSIKIDVPCDGLALCIQAAGPAVSGMLLPRLVLQTASTLACQVTSHSDQASWSAKALWSEGHDRT